jgi:pimeloyl-ACP methyl ester carboxylesterase
VKRVPVALATALVLLLAGCAPGSRWVDPGGSAAPSAAASASAAPGKVNWTDCRDEAKQLAGQLVAGFDYQCGTVQVPADWHAADNGKKFQIALMRVHNQKAGKQIGSLLVDPGGPGGSGVETAAYLPRELPSVVLTNFDIVGFDPRGVGQSTPTIDCISDANLDKMLGSDPDPVSQTDFDALTTLWKQIGQECQDKFGSDLSLFSTEQAARDMDAIRDALGDQKLTYLGWSYGTLLGAIYAQLFPTKVRALVLDGAVDPQLHGAASTESQLGGFEHAFDQFAAWCKQQSCPIAPDPRAAVAAAMTAARSNPVVGKDGRKATAGWITTGVAEALYSQQLWPVMAQAIKDLQGGNATRIFQLADEYGERDASGHYGSLLNALQVVSCDDDDSKISTDEIRSLQNQWRTKYPLFGAGFATGLVSCQQWPATRDPYPTGKATGAPPILVVGTVNDPATPYAQAGALASMLGNATVLTWNGQGHTAYPQTTCIRTNVDAYLIDLKVPDPNTTCPA